MSTRASFVAFTLLWSSATLFAQTMNTLSAPELAQGWQLLFNGKTLAGWHVSAPAPGSGRSWSGTAAAARAGRDAEALCRFAAQQSTGGSGARRVALIGKSSMDC